MAEHKDPAWWLRCDAVRPGQILQTDLCPYCGHARFLHNPAGGCRAISTSLVNNPEPCECTNLSIGVIYRDPATLRQLTARS